MKFSTIFILVITILSLVITLPSNANQYRSRATGNWNAVATWDSSGNGGVTWTTAKTTTPGVSSSDTALIRNGHTVTINTNFTITKLTVGEGASGVLNFDGTNRSVTITGDIIVLANGIFRSPSSATHTMNLGGNLTNNGTLNFRENASQVCNLTMNKSGTQSIGGTNAGTFNNLTIAATSTTIGNTAPTVGGTFTLSGNGKYIHTTATGIPGASRSFASTSTYEIQNSGMGFSNISFGNIIINFSGSTSLSAGGNLQTVQGDLIIQNTGTAEFRLGSTTSNTTSIGSDIIVNGGTFVFTSGSGTPTVNVSGDVLLNGGTLKPQGSTGIPTFTVAGNWTNNGGTYTIGSETVTFNGGGTQQINGTASSQTFNNITINKTVGTTLSVGGSTTTLTAYNLTGTQGNFTAPPTLNINGNLTLTAGTFTAGTNINSKGNWTNNGGTFTSGSGTVTFNSTTDAQSINGTAASQTFNNITVDKSSQSLSVGGSTTALNLNGTLTLTSGIFNAGTANVNIKGDWTNNGGTFTHNSKTVTFNGTGAQAINGSASSQTFYDVTINKSVSTVLSMSGSTTILTVNNLTETQGDFTAPATLNINGNLTLTGGTFTAGTNTYIKGNISRSSGIFTHNNGALTFNVTGSQSISSDFTGSSAFHNVVINSGTTVNTTNNIEIGRDWTAGGALNQTNGTTTFTGSGATHSFSGSGSSQFFNLTTTGSTINANASDIKIGGIWSHETSGIFNEGTSTVTFNGSGVQTPPSATYVPNFYNFVINKSAGTIGAKIWNVTNNFTLTLGSFSPSATSSFKNIAINGGTFSAPSGTITISGNWANGGGTFTSGTGTVTLNSTTTGNTFSGSMTGGNKFYNLTFDGIGGEWSFGSAVAEVGNEFRITNGTVTSSSGNLTITGNWINNGTFNHNNGIVIFNGVTVISGSSASSFKNITINGTLTAPSGNMNIAGNFVLNNTFNHNSGTITFNGTSAISGSSTSSFNNLTISGTLTAPSGNMNVAGNFINDNTFNHNSGTVTFNGTTAIGGASTPSFNNITITGSLTASSGNINIAGTWNNQGTFNHNSGTVTLNGTSHQTMSGSVFNNLTINNINGITLQTDQRVNGTLTLQNGNVTTGVNKMILGTSGNVSRISGHIVGKFQKMFSTGMQVFAFPIGVGSNFIPINLSFENVTNAGSVIALTTASEHPNISASGINSSKSVNRYWKLTAGDGISYTNYDVIFTFINPSDIDVGATPGKFIVRRYDGANWSATTIGTRTSTTTQATGITGMGDFAVGEAGIDHYDVSASSPQTAGATFSTTVTAKDVLNQTVVDDNSTVVTMSGTGSVQFDSDGNGTFGDNSKTLTAGTFDINTKDNIAETIDITATDGNTKTGTASGIVVNPGAVDHFALASISSPQIAGTAFNIDISAKDANNNTVTGFTGTVDLTTTAGSIYPTVSGAFTSGQRTESVYVTQAGTGKTITVTRTGSGETGTSNSFTVNNLVPTTTSINPTNKNYGDAGFTLTVYGTNFISSSVVRFDGSDRVTNFVDATELSASILASDLLAVGTFNITVFNPSPGGGTSNAQTFTVNKRPTESFLSSSLNPSVYFEEVTFKDSVTGFCARWWNSTI